MSQFAPCAGVRACERAVALAACALATLATAPAAQGGCENALFPILALPAGDQPEYVTTGDFNGDGNVDLAVANRSIGVVSVLLGNGAGGFFSPTSFPAGSFPHRVTTGDFDHDGNLDLAVANRDSDDVSILLGDGTGGFAEASTFSVGNYPSDVTANDFDGNGNLDLAVANFLSDDVWVLLGDGAGGFDIAAILTADNHPTALAAGHFDPGGNLDLAVLNQHSGNVSIHLGDGFGGFGSPSNFPVGCCGLDMTSGDFDGDEDLDLAVGYGTSVKILLGDGAGGFTGPSTFPGGPSVRTGDFDRDGDLDLAMVSVGDTVSILLGDGTGGFIGPSSFPVGDLPSSVTTADFDADGNLDLAVANVASDNVSILLGDGAGGFLTPGEFPAGDDPRSVTAGDFNGDGNLDLAVANAPVLPLPGNVSVMLGDGGGGFVGPTNYSAGVSPGSVTTGDFNGDGNLDLAVGNINSLDVSVLLGDGTGNFSGASSFPAGGNAYDVTAYDFDRDGNLDLAVANGSSFGTVSILKGNGNGGFGGPTSFPAGDPFRIATGDFDGDGNLDLAVANPSYDTISILLGNGDGSFGAPSHFPAGDSPYSVTTGDFNGDGNLDLAVANAEAVPGPGNVSVLLGDGLGGFVGPGNFSVGDVPRYVTTGDFDSDGNLDLAVANTGFFTGAAGSVSVLLGHGTGIFRDSINFPTGHGPWSMTTGDLDGDGDLDLAVANRVDDSVSVLLNQCLFGAPQEVPAAGAADRLDVGDLNRDGDTDVIVVIPGENPKAPGSVQVFRNLGIDGFGQWQGLTGLAAIPVGLQPSGVTLGFLNADRHLDAAVTNAGDDNVMLLFNDGTGRGTFGPPVPLPAGAEPSAVGAADFNGDGFVDLAVANKGADTIGIFVNDGTGAFTHSEDLPSGGPGPLASVGFSPVAVVPSDLDGDRDPDLTGLNQDASGLSSGVPGSVFVILNNPGKGFGEAVTYPIGVAPTDLAVADLDHDGMPDIVASNSGSGTASILVNQGDGTFAPGTVLPVGDSPLSVEAADFDGDGDADLAVVATDPDPDIGPAVRALENLGTSPGNLSFGLPVSYTVNATPNFLASAYLNGDLELDLVTANTDDGSSEESTNTGGAPTGGSVSALLNTRPPCPGDVNFNGLVGMGDLETLMEDWGQCPGGDIPCPSDLNGDGSVDVIDFLTLLTNWGNCP